jgi:hypothetical protein
MVLERLARTLAALDTWIERVAKAVGDGVQAQNEQCNRQSGYRVPGRLAQELAAF